MPAERLKILWINNLAHDKICAYQTLYECLETVVKLMAPISPFFSDVLFQNLNKVTGRDKAASVHHTDFPVANESNIDSGLEERMRIAQDIAEAGADALELNFFACAFTAEKG